MVDIIARATVTVSLAVLVWRSRRSAAVVVVVGATAVDSTKFEPELQQIDANRHAATSF